MRGKGRGKARPEKKRGRRPADPNAPLPPTISVPVGAKRYGIGRDQMYEAVKAKEVPAIEIGGRFRIIRSKADAMFGVT